MVGLNEDQLDDLIGKLQLKLIGADWGFISWGSGSVQNEIQNLWNNNNSNNKLFVLKMYLQSQQKKVIIVG